MYYTLAEGIICSFKNMLNKIIEKSSDLIYVLNTDKKILRANKAAEKILGYIPSQLTGNLYREYIHKDDYKKWEKATAKVISGESVPDFEQRFIHKNGYEVLLTCSLLYDSNEERIYCIANEIPGRVKAEKEIKKSEEKYQILFDLSPIPKYVYDLQTLRIIDVNRAAIDHYGYSKEEFLKLKIQDLRLKSDIPRLLKSIEKYQTSSGIIRFGVYSHLKKDGSITKMDISGQKFIYDGQTRIMVIANDVTQQHNDQKQKRLLADIRQIFSQQQRLKNVLKDVLAHLVNSGEFHLGEIWMTSRDQNLLNLTTIYPKSDFTSAFYELSSDIKTIKNGEGLPGSVWSSKKREIWDHLGDKSRFIRSDAAKETGLESAMGIPLIYNEEVLGVLLLGSKKSGDVLDSTKYLFSDLETIIGSELKRKQLEEDYNQIFNTAPDIICMIDFEGSFKRINPEGSKLLGYSEDELLNMPYIELVHPDDRAVFKNQLEESFQSDTTIKLTHRVVPISGNFIWLDWSIRQTTEEGISYGVAKNITELKELQKLLDEATDLARIGGWHLDLISKEVYWSPMTRKLHEVGEEFEPDLESGINFYREDVRDKVKEYVDQAISSGDSWNFELPIITAKGREIWIKSIGKVEYKDGSPIRMVGSFQDIHDRKMAELRLQNTADNIPGAIFQYILHPDGTDEISSLTKGAIELWGFTAEECMEDNDIIWKQTKSEGDFDKVLESINRSAETMEPWHCQYRSRLPNGKLLWHEGFGRPRKSSGGTIIWDSLIIDITEQKELETLLDRANEMAKMGSWELDLTQDGSDKMYWSPMTRKILEVDDSYDTSLSRGYEFYSDDSKKEIQPAVEQLIESGKTFDLELKITSAEGNQKWIRCIGEAERLIGKTVKIFGSLQDITKTKSYEESLQKLNENLEQHAKELAISNRELEQFAFVTSHDLQEPLRMISSFLAQLEKKYGDQLDEKAHQYIYFAVDGAKRMRQIILDLLDFSKIGKSNDLKENVDLEEIVQETCQLQRKAIEESSAIVIKENLPTILAERAVIAQIFQNLIGNAIKYRKEGVPPKVKISAKELNEEWIISVEDNGIGIHEEYFGKIFTIFQKLHEKERYDGTGMGLAIVKKSVENLGGKIWVESTPSKGSTFKFSIKK